MTSHSIAIIGAGFTGLAAAYELRKKGYNVMVFEASDVPGGLAAGFQEEDWDWSLEKHYHHIFESDHDIQAFVKELGLEDTLFFSEVVTKTSYNKQQFRLDSALTLLKAPAISPIAKFRTAATLALLKFSPYLPYYEKQTAKEFLLKTMGEESWRVLWKPLFEGKFGNYADKVNAAWFWARIHVRSKKLGYFKGGFANLADQMVEKLTNDGITFHFTTPIKSIKPTKQGKFSLQFQPSTINHQPFDQVLVAAPSMILTKLVPELPAAFTKSITNLTGLGAMTLVLELDKPFFQDSTYWLNINEKDWPFLAVVEHTNLAGKNNYDGKTILYVGKYLEPSTEQFSLNKEELLKKYHPFLEKLSPGFSQHITKSWLFKEFFAQPVVFPNHIKNVPTMETPIPNLYWASMQHVYPWDRGTNFAVKLGKEVAERITGNRS